MTKFISALVLFLFVHPASAFVSPLSVGLVKPVQFPPEDFSVAGLRVSGLWGQHRDMYGIDIGLLGNITEQSFVGIAVAGAFNNTRGETRIIGLQLGGLANYNTGKTRVYGLQASLGFNYNSAESHVKGFQVALANVSSHTEVIGAQIGIYNRAKAVYGVQIGLVNVCDNLHGLQIGLANFHHTGIFAVSPILNVGF